MIGLSSASSAQVEDKRDEKEVAASKDKISDMMRSYDAELSEVRRRAQVVYNKEMLKLAHYYKEVVEEARLNPGSEGSAKGLAWAIPKLKGQDRADAFGLLVEHHKDRDCVIRVLTMMARDRSANTEAIEKLIEESKNQKVVEEAVYTLATIYSRMPDKSKEALALYKKFEGLPGIEESNPILLARIKKQLIELEFLFIGSEAPEIVGTDEDDKEFKLSDYRGKVVLIDFWGIW